MTVLAADEGSDLLRWAAAGVLALAAHGTLAAALVQWREPVEAPDVTGAVIVEFSPQFIAAPQLVQSEAVPEQPVEKIKTEPEEKVTAKDEDPIQEKVEEKPIEAPPQEAVPVTTPPPPELPQTAALPAGPLEGPQPRPIDIKAMQTWLAQISAAIERKKRYPATALTRQEHGEVQVSFTLDRHGRVTDSRIVRSSGAADLDEEALELLVRAQPFPPWPEQEGSAGSLRLTVPVRFNLK